MSQQGYIGRNPGDGRTIVNRQTTHVTTGVQTSFTMTTGYEVGYLDVYLNGIKQTETLDYTASDGSTINFALSFPPVNGDVLEFVAFETLNITNIKSARRNFSVGQDLDVSGKVTIGSSLTVASDLVVNGTFTTINTEILDVEDKTVGIASTSSPSNTTADGAGIVIYGGSDGDKSLTWNSTKSNFVLVGGGVSIGTGVTISTPAANVLAFSVNSAEKARFNNFGAFTVGYEGEAWHESTYVGVLQAGSGAWIGQTPGASARAEWTNNAYYDSVNTRWEYIAADEANRIVLENGELKLQSADAGSADGAITWNEKLKMTVGGDFKIGAPTGIGITISSSGNVDSIGIVTASSFVGNVTGNATSADTIDITNTSTDSSFALTFVDTSGSAKTLRADTSGILFNPSSNTLTTGTFSGSGASLTNLNAGNLASGTVPTARLGSGTASSSTFLRGDSTFATVTSTTINNNANNRIITGSGTADTLEAESGLTFDGTNLDLGANDKKIRLGASNQLYFEANSGGYGLFQNNTGVMYLLSNDFTFRDQATNDDLLKLIGEGAVELYHNNIKRFETASYGVLSSNQVRVAASNASTVAFSVGDAGTGFYNTGSNAIGYSANGTQKWNINSSGELILQDSVKIKFGTSSDAEIYHDTADTYFKNSTGTLYFRSDTISLNALSTTDTYLSATDGGGVSLRHDNSEKFVTSSTGATVTGTVVADNTAGRNMIINGDMRLAQRGTSASYDSSSTAILACDRWNFGSNGSSGTVAQVTERPNNEFQHSLKATVTSPVSGSLSAGNMFKFMYKVERQDVQRLDYGSSTARTSTLSFWVKGSLAGKIGVTCSRNSRIFATNFDITANTWTFAEVVIPADTSTALSGTMYDSGFDINIVAGAGSNATSGTTGGSWAGFHVAYTAGFTAGQQGAYLTTNGATFQITGVQFEIGSKATVFEHRPITEELLRCARYYQEQQGHSDMYIQAGKGQGSTTADVGHSLVVPMRAQPSITLGGHRVFHDGGLSGSTSAPSVINWDNNHSPHSSIIALNLPGHSGFTNNEVLTWCPHNALLQLNAEL